MRAEFAEIQFLSETAGVAFDSANVSDISFNSSASQLPSLKQSALHQNQSLADRIPCSFSDLNPQLGMIMTHDYSSTGNGRRCRGSLHRRLLDNA
jgi:hypothetical protein